jgi:Ni/Co efflux regulator RcnB
MKNLSLCLAAIALVAGSAGTAVAQDHGRGNGNGHHDDRGDRGRGNDNGQHRGWGQDRGNGHRWARGERMGYNDWNGASRVDYRRYHLRQPPRGYEWRQQNGQFILGAVATGVIASIILNNGR